MKRAISMFARLMFAFVVFFSFVPFVANAQTNQEPLIYGQTYHLVNEVVQVVSGGGSYLDNGGYLDTRNRGCNGNAMCVSTSYGKDRDAGSGSWKIISTRSGQNGQRVMNEEVFFLENQYRVDRDKLTYLDTRNRGCENAFCVSTSFERNRDSGSGQWKILLVSNSSSGNVPVNLNQDFRLLNGYDRFGGGYLDTLGSGCEGNKRCVSTSLTYISPNTRWSTQWRFVQ